MIKKLLQGMVVGIANIIPGVSGGTMMVAMGLYDKLIHAITHLKSEFKNSMKLLIPIFIGAGAAIVILSRLFEFLLENYPIPTNFAFCGLIAGSLPFIFNKVKRSLGFNREDRRIFDLFRNSDTDGFAWGYKRKSGRCKFRNYKYDQVVQRWYHCGCNDGRSRSKRIYDAYASRIL